MTVKRLSQLGLLTIAMMALAPTVAPAAIINGDFSTGDLTGWTPFDDPNGTANGEPTSGGLPVVTVFDVTGNGDSSAVQLRVGRTGGPAIDQGGGIFQSIQTAAGVLTLTVDFAVEATGNNAQGGLLELSVNGLVVDSEDILSVSVGEVIRDQLTASLAVGAGSQEIRLSARRLFGAGSANTPAQYFDNVVASGSAVAVPEPASTVSLLLAGLSLGACRIRRKKA